MLDTVEILDLQHCRKQDPMWAEKKAGHCLADAAACDARAEELIAARDSKARTDDALPWFNMRIQSFNDMAARYRARAKILMGEA